jgi:predicted DNA-binding transcriptional regulator YafY
MAQAARLGKIMTLLRAHRHGVPTKKFLERLSVSRATFFRDIEVLRDQMMQPIAYSDDRGGWTLDKQPDPSFVRDELPGVMLTGEECYALLTLHNVLRAIDPGFLEEFVHPLRGVLKQIVINQLHSTAGLDRKVAISIGPIFKGKPMVFSRIAEALVRDKRLKLGLVEWSSGAKLREVSPQRIVLTPKGWMLHVLDHTDNQVRKLSLPEIAHAKVLKVEAKRLPSYEAGAIHSSEPLNDPLTWFGDERPR